MTEPKQYNYPMMELKESVMNGLAAIFAFTVFVVGFVSCIILTALFFTVIVSALYSLIST